MAQVAVLYDSSRCTGCRACQVACKQWHDLPAEPTVNWGSYENPADLSPMTFSRMRFIETGTAESPRMLYLNQGCMHCTDAACVKVCPTHALSHHPSGAVTFERERCNGCGYCTQFCAFHIPRLDGDVVTGVGKSSKCDMCQDRTSNGEPPACVKTCPTGALSFGPRDGLIARGRQRVELLKANGHANANFYGDTLLGGLHRMYVLDDKPEVYQLPTDPRSPALAGIWQEWVQPLAELSFVGGIVGAGLAFAIVRRNIRMQDVE
jgi:formate dehydrogenase iron-sulfur subunit